MAKLSAKERDKALGRLNGWVYDEDGRRHPHEFKFKDFSEAFAFMTRVALAGADRRPPPRMVERLQQGVDHAVDP